MDFSFVGYLTGLIVFLCLMAVFIVFQNSQEKSEQNQNRKVIAFCGNSLSDYEEEGKTLFRNYCAPCHMNNMRTYGTGPALYKSLGNWSCDTISITNYLNHKFDSISNPRMEELRREYEFFGVPHGFNLTIDEVKDLISYIER